MRKSALHTHPLALVAVLVLLAACSSPAATPGSSQPQTATPVPTVEPTLAPDAPCLNCWPLNGKPLQAGAADKRALLVKIDNVPLARPHYGITQADMVFEILV